MKKILLITGAILMVTLGFAQTNFKWDKVDSVAKNKAQLYSDTKMFISEYWKSSKEVIQNDDKEGGVILIKAIVIMNVSYMGGNFKYVYNYNVTFRVKDNKYKVNIDNVYCESARDGTGGSTTMIDPFEGDNCPETGTWSKPGLPKKKVIPMMPKLKAELQAIIDDYDKYIKKPNANSGDW